MVRGLWLALPGFALACGLTVSGEAPTIPAEAGASQDDGGSALDEYAPPAPLDGGEEAVGDASATRDAVQDMSVNDDGAADADAASSGFALAFDGTSSYVDCGNVPIPGNFTLEAWVYPNAFQGETYVIAEDRKYQPNGQFRFGFIDTGQLFFVMSDGTGNMWGLQANTSAPYNLLSPAALPAKAWSEVAVTKKDTMFSLVVNGQVVQNVTASGSFVFNNGGQQNPFRIASRVAYDSHSADGVFDGIIDEVRFWNAARSAMQIQMDMRREITATDPSWSTLQDYWPFDEGSGISTADRTSTHVGTLTSGPRWVVSTAF